MGNSSMPSATSKVIQTNNIKEDHEEVVSITEKINLTKKQYEVLNIICNTFGESISQYLQEALVEAMKFDIEEGNFCDTLLEKIDNDGKNKNNSPPSSSPSSLAPDLMNTDLDLLKSCRRRYSSYTRFCKNDSESYVTGHKWSPDSRLLPIS